ncbi:MAG: tyrosine-type recombinase/integrase [Chloroflexota bacterium]
MDQFLGVRSNTLFFCTSKGTPISQRNLTRDFLKVIRKTELPQIRFHDLRHTAASLMINRGVPIIVVSKMLGHSKPSVTLNIYAHCVSEYQYEAARIMEEIATPLAIDLEELHQESKY